MAFKVIEEGKIKGEIQTPVLLGLEVGGRRECEVKGNSGNKPGSFRVSIAGRCEPDYAVPKGQLGRTGKTMPQCFKKNIDNDNGSQKYLEL